ncbi:type II secretion system F family protein [Actinotalea sp. M2MS4P-6]|uniref:type II secretion system F family protein n=1 Tax=Actinotalea sp. M2MS4P-6 TaxID=2983762 RepID=UPI0021E3B1F2|nr:type II secretion system F family protein [Actinotalea sp. M2MS4P-6]MCV2393749.1 type II secretion system F family protein [Actinotalea sp. M2MS4P-6]
MTPVLQGALAGLVLGLGGLLVLAWVDARRPTLDARLAPYLRVPQRTSALLDQPAPRTPLGTLERLLAPVMADAVRLVERLGSPDVADRLARAGRSQSVEEFRIQQVVAGVVGLGAGLAFTLALAAGRGVAPVAGALLVLVAGLSGVVLRDVALSRQVRRRSERILLELPTIAELLALAVGAGEGALGAIERVAQVSDGALTGELRRVVAEARSGTPLVVALEQMADRTAVPALSRFAEAIVVAVERGTPLADVLRAQATDARETSRRELMELGGRKEVAMMVPVVFLILPVTVVFAVFPGLSALRLDL